MIKERIEYTNVVYNEASNKARGLRPYIIDDDGYLIAPLIKFRKEYRNPVTVFYLTVDESEKVDEWMSAGRNVVDKLNREKELVIELIKSKLL